MSYRADITDKSQSELEAATFELERRESLLREHRLRHRRQPMVGRLVDRETMRELSCHMTMFQIVSQVIRKERRNFSM
jgi:hypothetical protein